MKPTIRYQYEAVRPEPIMVTVDGVTFPLNEKLALFYKLAEYAGMLEAFMAEMKPYYWKEYRAAVRLKEIEAQRKRQILEQVDDQKRAKDADKARLRRLRKKSGATTPDSTALTPEKGNTKC